MKKALVSLVLLLSLSGNTYAQAHFGPGEATVERAHAIIIGTAQEFPGLVAQGQSTDAMVELLRRMIWHLQQAGIQAGRQKNPSGAISGDKLTAFVDNGWHAYDVLSDRPSGPFDVHMDEVFPANFQSDSGIPDSGANPPSTLPTVPPIGGPTPTPGFCLPLPDPEIPRLFDNLYQQNERIFANLTEQNNACRLLQQNTFDLLKRHDEEPMFITKLLANRYVQMGIAAVATRLGFNGGKLF